MNVFTARETEPLFSSRWTRKALLQSASRQVWRPTPNQRTTSGKLLTHSRPADDTPASEVPEAEVSEGLASQQSEDPHRVVESRQFDPFRLYPYPGDCCVDESMLGPCPRSSRSSQWRFSIVDDPHYRCGHLRGNDIHFPPYRGQPPKLITDLIDYVWVD